MGSYRRRGRLWLVMERVWWPAVRVVALGDLAVSRVSIAMSVVYALRSWSMHGKIHGQVVAGLGGVYIGFSSLCISLFYFF